MALLQNCFAGQSPWKDNLGTAFTFYRLISDWVTNVIFAAWLDCFAVPFHHHTVIPLFHLHFRTAKTSMAEFSVALYCLGYALYAPIYNWSDIYCIPFPHNARDVVRVELVTELNNDC
jgi:hypothetical protein